MTPNATRLQERFAADPGDRAAFELLEEQLYLAARWAELVPLYEAHLAASEASRPATDRARLRLRMGQAIEEGLGDPTRAAACYRHALELDPACVPALRRLRAACLATARFEEAAGLTAREATLAPGPEVARAFAEIGSQALAASEFGVAATSFEGALGLKGDEANALAGLPRALEGAGRLNEAVGAWERAIERLSGAARSDAIRALGALLAGPLADDERALQHFQRACDEDRASAEWVESLFAVLIRVGRFEAAAALGARRLEGCTDLRQRAAIALEIGRVHLDRLAAPSEARAWFERAAEWNEDGSAALALAEAAGRLGDAAGRAYYLERAMELGAEIPEWSDLGLGDTRPNAETLAALERETAAHGDDPDALEVLAAALGESGRYAECTAVLERRAQLPATEPSERAELWLEIGELREQRLDDPHGAAAAYRCALEADPERALGDGALEAVLRRMGRLDELAVALGPAIAAAAPARRAALLCRLGSVELELGNAASASERFALALGEDPASERARAGTLRAAEARGDERTILDLYAREAERCDLERLAELGREALRRSAACDDPDAALLVVQRWAERSASGEAQEALFALFEASGRTDELVAALERLDASLSGVERAANRRRLGYLHAAEDRLDDAIAAWRAALEADASDLASLEALTEALADAGREAELLALCDERGPGVLLAPHVEALRAQALERAGRISEAAERFRALRASGAADDESLAGLERTARALGDAATLADALGQRAARSDDPALRERWSLERAELLDVQLDDAEAAAAVYAELAEHTSDTGLRELAIDRLDASLERRGRFAELCDRLEARLANDAVAGGAAARQRIAELAAAKLGDRARARRHLEAAVALAPERADLWRQLAGLLDEESDAPALLSALEGEVAAAPPRERMVALHQKIARIAHERLGDAARAEQHFRAALALDPSHESAHAFVAERLESAERWSDLAALLDARLAASPPAEPAVRMAMRIRLAQLLADRLERPHDAIAPLEAARAEAGAVAAIAESLADLYARTGRGDAHAALCTQAAECAATPVEAAAWWTRAADAAQRVADDARAADCYRRALALQPEAEASRTSLLAILRRCDDSDGLVGLLEDETQRPGRDSAALRVEIAQLCEATQQPERACAHWSRAAALAPDDQALRERALELALALGRHDEASDLLRSAATDPRSRDRARLWRRCGELAAATRPDDAIDAFRESLALDPKQGDLRRSRRALLEARGRAGEALAELVIEIQAAAPDERAELAALGADLAAAHEGPAAATPWLALLAAEQPDDPALWIAMARRYGLAHREDDQERALAEAARRCGDRASCAALHRERAQLLAASSAGRGRVLAALEAARAQDPDHSDTLVALDRLYTEAGRTRELLGVLEARLRRARDAERAALQRRAAECAEAIGEVALAADLWRGAVEGVSAAESRGWIARAVDAQRSAQRVDAFIALAERELPTAASERRRALHRDVARALSDELAQPARALVHLRAVADDPASDARDRAALFAALRRERALGELARRLAEHLRRDAADTIAWRELAELREDALFDPTGAAAAWRALAERDPCSRAALAGLRRSAERSADARELARVLEREIEIAAHEPAGLWRRLARVRLDGLGDTDGAARAFASARAVDPNDLASLRALQQLAEARADWSALIQRSAEEIAQLGNHERARVRSLWLRIGHCAASRTRELGRAAEAFERAEEIESLDAASLAAWAGVLRELGVTARWRTVFAAFCDHPDAKVDTCDHLLLAQSLADADAPEEAARRLALVFEREPENAAAWALSARLRSAAGDAEGATAAWTRAAEASSGLEAARAWRAAAAAWETTDPARAHDLLARAVEAFPAYAPAHAARAVAAERIGRHEVAIHAASSALGSGALAAPLTREERLAGALAGARSAYTISRWPSAWELAGEVLALDPENPDAWLARGVAAFHMGSPAACCRGLETWLATSPAESLRPLPLAILADACAAQGDTASALARYRESLALDPAQEVAHAGLCALFERRGEVEQAAAAFADWAACTASEAPRADRFVRAARLARQVPDAGLPIETWLRAALTARAAHANAWLDLTTWLADAGRADDAYEAATAGAACVDVPQVTAALELYRARTLEARGDDEAACRAHQRAAKLDPNAAEAAFAAARLLRRAGAWSTAADCLGDFAARHQNATVCAELLAERARLLAGPLEDLPGALAALRRAHTLAPERLDVREALGALLAQLPDAHDEARTELFAVLEARPLQVTALRRLARLHQERGRAREAAGAMALLHALGATAPGERTSAPATLGFAIGDDSLATPALDALRTAILSVAGDWAEALLGEVDERSRAAAEPAVARMQAAWNEAKVAIGGPALASLSADAFARGGEVLVRTALGTAASLAASRDTLAVVERMSGRAIRRLRRALAAVPADVVRSVDFRSFTDALRALALADAVDRCEGDLHAALVCAWISEAPVDATPLPADADLISWATSSPIASDLVARAVRAWMSGS